MVALKLGGRYGRGVHLPPSRLKCSSCAVRRVGTGSFRPSAPTVPDPARGPAAGARLRASLRSRLRPHLRPTLHPPLQIEARDQLRSPPPVSQIAANGYQMIYLTARGIGMATTTKEYLASIKQGDDRLPSAPVLLSPTRLIESLTREVIRRNPEEFKIECLKKIRSLWPEVRRFWFARLCVCPLCYKRMVIDMVAQARYIGHMLNPHKEHMPLQKDTRMRRSTVGLGLPALPPGVRPHTSPRPENQTPTRHSQNRARVRPGRVLPPE